MQDVHRRRLAALFARTSDDALFDALAILDAVAKPSEEQRMSRAWMLDEIERRYPATIELLEAWCEDEGTASESYAAAAIRFARQVKEAGK